MEGGAIRTPFAQTEESSETAESDAAANPLN
jgi:hypothetical protein